MTNESNDKSSQSPESKNTPNPPSDGEKDGETWGFDMYPERRGGKVERSWFSTMIGRAGKEGITKLKCEENVYNCSQDSPIIKLMLAALKSSGCEFDLRRHVSCEMCDGPVTGGYDQELNQVVICHNMAKSRPLVESVLAHEMIHMFDYCRNELDFKNIDHLACTEIRAANLTHCSFLSAFQQGDASPINIKQRHQDCVRSKALWSVLAARNTTEKEARAAIERVFPKCYNDMEPIGRRIRRNSSDVQKAYIESPLFGYIP